MMRIRGFENLLKEFERCYYTSSTVTLVGGDEAFRFDLNRKGDQVRYGYHSFHKPFISARILGMLGDYGVVGITVRSFLKEKHPETVFPYKEIRGYVARLEGDEVSFDILPVRDLSWACTTDSIEDLSLDLSKTTVQEVRHYQTREGNLYANMGMLSLNNGILSVSMPARSINTFVSIPPDETPPSISNIEREPQSPKPGEQVTVTVTITDTTSGVDETTLYYRIDGGAWTPRSMSQTDDVWSATIPAQESGVTVSYYIEASDTVGNSIETSIYSYTVIEEESSNARAL